MTTHTRHDLERLSRFSRREFSHAFMSDTKWRKLLAGVDEAGLRPDRIIVKFVDRSGTTAISWPGVATQFPPRPWIDCDLGPVELRSIEWILIPATYQVPAFEPHVPPREVAQDLDAIENFISALGQFPLERSAEGLRIVGYRR